MGKGIKREKGKHSVQLERSAIQLYRLTLPDLAITQKYLFSAF